MPAELLTIENLETCQLLGTLHQSYLILSGTKRDNKALLQYASHIEGPTIAIVADHLTDQDVEYVSNLVGHKELAIIMRSPSASDRLLLERLPCESVTIEEPRREQGFFDVELLPKVRNLRVDAPSRLVNEDVVGIVRWNRTLFSEFTGISKATTENQKRWQADGHNFLALYCDVDNSEIAAISKSLSIRYLSVGSKIITDKGLEALSAMTNLRRLRLFESKCTFAGLQNFCRLVELESLHTDICKEPPGRVVWEKTAVLNLQQIREIILEEQPTATSDIPKE
jgi:hypothetical protein